MTCDHLTPLFYGQCVECGETVISPSDVKKVWQTREAGS